VAKLKAAVDAIDNWQQKPLGPCLSYIQIKPKYAKFAAVIETAIVRASLTI
jgi:hypothetical protein